MHALPFRRIMGAMHYPELGHYILLLAQLKRVPVWVCKVKHRIMTVKIQEKLNTKTLD